MKIDQGKIMVILILLFVVLLLSCNRNDDDDDNNDEFEIDDDNDDNVEDDDDISDDDSDMEYPPINNVLSKSSTTGLITWSKSFDFSGWWLSAMELVPNNNIFIAEYNDDNLYCYNLSGELLWINKFINTNSSNVAIEKFALFNNGIFFVDNGFSEEDKGRICQINNIDDQGKVLWSTDVITGYSYRMIYDIEPDQQGNLIVAGYTGDSQDSYMVLQKYSLDGAMLWSRLIKALDTLQTPGLSVDEEGFLYVSGQSIGEECLLAKIDAEGITIWEKYFSPSGTTSSTCSGYKVVVDEEKCIYVATECGWEESCLLKYDPDGNVLWEIVRDSVEHEFNMYTDRFLSFDPEGNLIFATADGNNIVSAKYDRDGIIQWDARYTGTARDLELGDMEVDLEGNVYLAGLICDRVDPYSDEVCLELHYYIIKYSNIGEFVWISHIIDENQEKNELVTEDFLIIAFSMNGKGTNIVLSPSLRMDANND